MARTDQELKKDILDCLQWDDRVDASDVHVRVQDAVVCISGTVPSHLARQAVTYNVAAVCGVRRIDNQLVVRYTPTLPVPSDADLKSSTEQMLRCNASLDADTVRTTVHNGVVTLEGTVDAYWKKVYAEDLVLNMSGVISVDDKLAITPKSTHSDRRIAEQIVAAIDRSRLLDVESLDVFVKDGTVTLQGLAPNWAAHRSAYQAALYTPGVVQIKDRITVP